MSSIEALQQADSNYHSFPSFELWAQSSLDLSKWDKYTSRLRDLSAASSPEILKQAQEHVKRVAAVQTGVIEDLYEVDRGFTFVATAETALWQAALSQKEETARNLIEDQLRAYDHVLDFATKESPMGEAYIRELHKVICARQETYKAHTLVGTQEQRLPLGVYKIVPNHVLQPNKVVHSYAPVEITSSEMHKLCGELNSDLFNNAHPILQASYIHYGLVAIHPFTDGNGRVARALASIYTYRSNSIPLLITDDMKNEYFDSLAAADNGHYQRFTNFIFERGVDSIRLVEESLNAASRPSIEESRKSIFRLYTTKGGYEHAEVDKAGYKLFDLFTNELNNQAAEFPKDAKIALPNIQMISTSSELSKKTNRWPIQDGPRGVRITLSTKHPAKSKVELIFVLEVPKDADQDDELLIRCLQAKDDFEARVSEILPIVSVALEMRLRIAVQRIFAGMMDGLRKTAEDAIRNSGYR